MSVAWLENLDRRWLFLIVGVLVLGPLIKPLGAPRTRKARSGSATRARRAGKGRRARIEEETSLVPAVDDE